MHRALLAALGVSFAIAPTALAAPAAPDVPSDIAVPAGNEAYLVGHATGVQIYRCHGQAWTFVEPKAELRGDNGEVVARNRRTHQSEQQCGHGQRKSQTTQPGGPHWAHQTGKPETTG